MRVLHVVDRIGRVLLFSLGDIEVDGLVGRTREHQIARRVDTDLVDELLERDHLAGALGHADRHAVPEQVDHLADDDFGLARMAEHVSDRLNALDVAMVIGAEDVDAAVEATVELVFVVGDIGREVSVGTVCLYEHAILVVAEIGRPEPDRAVLLVQIAALAQGVERTREA